MCEKSQPGQPIKMDRNWISQAVWNNAVWCDVVCVTHGNPGDFLDGFWICRQKAPPFYPNLITLDKHLTTTQLARIHSLLAEDLPYDSGIKDSYSNLDLIEFGFQILFEAQWVCLPVSVPIPTNGMHKDNWDTISDNVSLNHWEQVWRGLPSNALGSKPPVIFRPDLLLDNRLSIIAAYEGGQIIAGAIGLLTGQVVGVSNMFMPVDDRIGYRADCIAKLREIFPGKTLVGYESADDLDEMRAVGFEKIGPLRIWVRNKPE